MQKGGFFNSTDHDRRYSALDFNQLIDTIKSDGIDQYGDKLEVIAGEGLNVIVKSGKAFYNQHWLFNDANLTLELEQASPTQDRIDAIIIEVNETDRTMLIKAVTGEPSNTPVAPALVETTNIHQYYLAWVEVDTGSLVVGTITDKRTEWADIESVRQDENELTTSNLVNSLASIENTNVASKNYNVGDYLTMNGVLYKVAVAITQGSSLVVGTNITSTDTGTELVGAINSAKASAINLATIEPTNIASQTYAVGSYLVYNGLLYKVTSAIAQGATLRVGTNISLTKVGTELSVTVPQMIASALEWKYAGDVASGNGQTLTLPTSNYKEILIQDYSTYSGGTIIETTALLTKQSSGLYTIRMYHGSSANEIQFNFSTNVFTNKSSINRRIYYR